jgi:hypothetical protein
MSPMMLVISSAAVGRGPAGLTEDPCKRAGGGPTIVPRDVGPGVCFDVEVLDVVGILWVGCELWP